MLYALWYNSIATPHIDLSLQPPKFHLQFIYQILALPSHIYNGPNDLRLQFFDNLGSCTTLLCVHIYNQSSHWTLKFVSIWYIEFQKFIITLSTFNFVSNYKFLKILKFIKLFDLFDVNLKFCFEMKL